MNRNPPKLTPTHHLAETVVEIFTTKTVQASCIVQDPTDPRWQIHSLPAMSIRQSQHSTGNKPSADVFIRACKRANDCLDKSEQGKFLKMIPFNLTDTALSIIEAASLATLEQLLKELRRAFSKVQNLHDL